MKKATTKATIIILIVLVAVVGVFAYLQGKIRTESNGAVMTEAERLLYEVLNRNMSINYPSSPREVIKYYVQIQKCFYSDSTTAEDLEQLGMKARELYDADLLAINAEEDNLINLMADVNEFKNKKRTMINAEVASSLNVDKFKEDGYEFARIGCNYSIMEGSTTNTVSIIYLLRFEKNENGGGKWKIYGWNNAENVHVQ